MKLNEKHIDECVLEARKALLHAALVNLRKHPTVRKQAGRIRELTARIAPLTRERDRLVRELRARGVSFARAQEGEEDPPLEIAYECRYGDGLDGFDLETWNTLTTRLRLARIANDRAAVAAALTALATHAGIRLR